MEHYLNCKKIDTAIRRAQKKLVAYVKKNGFYENFGQEEVRKIHDYFIDLSDYTEEMNLKRMKLDSFDYWCMNCDLNEIEKINL